MTRRIRVTQVLEATAGGTRRHLHDIVFNLPHHLFEFRIICATHRTPTFREDVAEFRRAGIEVVVLPMRRAPHPFADPYCAWQLRRELLRHPCDVLHLHSAKAGFVGRWAAIGMPCAVLYSPHAFPFLQPGPIGAAAAAAERLSAWRTDLLVAVSHAEGELALGRKLVKGERLRVIPNAIKVGPDLAEPHAPSRAERCLGFIGELRAQKAPLPFVDAARIAVAAGAQATFLLPDQGPELGAVRQRIADYGMERWFRFVPTRSGLDAVYCDADVAILPSLWEGLPYALLDAYARGQVAITSDLPVFVDLVGRIEHGLLARAGNPEATAERILYWSRAPLERLRALGRVAHQYALQHHAISTWTASMTQLYSDADALARGCLTSDRVSPPGHRASPRLPPELDTVHSRADASRDRSAAE